MKKLHVILLSALVAAMVGYGSAQLAAPAGDGTVQTAAKESAYDRVMRTQTLRCGYTIFQPHLMKDPNTGVINGAGAEIMAAMTKLLGWQLEWVEEAPIASIFEGLKNGRYDAICAPLFIRPNNMALVEFVGPLYYAPVNAYAKPQDVARLSSRAALADPATRLSAIDGTTPYLLAKSDFPTAQIIALPEKADYGDVLLQVVTNKADAVLVDAGVAGEFEKSNPGKLQLIAAVSPLRIFPYAFNVMKGEQELANTLNWAVEHLRNNGQLEPILAKYEPVPNAFMRAAPRYITK